MNIQSFSKKVAVFAITAAAASITVNAQSYELTGKVPVEFRITKKTFSPGEYRIVATGTKAFTLKTAAGRNEEVAVLPVQTKSAEAKASSMTLRVIPGSSVYQLAEYCVAGQGCWASMSGPRQAEAIHIALK